MKEYEKSIESCHLTSWEQKKKTWLNKIRVVYSRCLKVQRHCQAVTIFVSKAFKLTGPPSSPGCPWLPWNPGLPWKTKQPGFSFCKQFCFWYNELKGLDTLNPGSPTPPRSPLVPIHLHGTPQHSLSAILSCTAKENEILSKGKK